MTEHPITDAFAAPRAGSDALRFLRAWAAAPLVTGAQLPSGRQLARAMAAAVDPAIPGVVVELGPGTGIITGALIARGVAADRLVLVEANPAFCTLLAARYPGAQLMAGDAYQAPRALKAAGVGPVAAIVSGLPLRTQKPRRRQCLLLECLKLAAPGAPFVQFTYFYNSLIPVSDAVIASDVSPVLWRNLWPARVWRYRLHRRTQT